MSEIEPKHFFTVNKCFVGGSFKMFFIHAYELILFDLSAVVHKQQVTELI